MSKVSISKVQKNISEIVRAVARENKRVVIARGNKALAAIVPIQDYEYLEKEDRLDIEAAERAWKEMQESGEELIPWEQAKKELGME